MNHSRLAAALLAAAALAVLPACVEDETTVTTVGNQMFTCPANSSCSCDITGNCLVDCPGGGCELACTGMSNCVFTCGEPGGCAISCANMGNCEATCAGGGCDMTCTGTGNGVLSGAGCTATRMGGMGNCVVVP